MASTTDGIRLVRCPKCHKVLMEFAGVPVYECGGCGTVLRAKIRVSTAEKTVAGSLENNSQDGTEGSSLVNESASLVKRAEMFSSEVDSGLEKVVDSDQHVPTSNTECDYNWTGESSEQLENWTEGRRSKDSRADINGLAENHPEERNQARQEFSVNEVIENPLLLITKGAHMHNLSEKMEKSSDSVGNDAAISEDDKRFTSQAYYDGSVSSRDEEPEDRVPPKYRIVSKRTFRHKVLGMADSPEKETCPQTEKLPIELPNERLASAVKSSIAPNGDEFPRNSRSLPRVHERDTTFGSEDFHSVQNWLGSENENGDLSSLSKDILFQRQSFNDPNANLSTKVNDMEPGHVKILRKVDELRDELSEFLAKTVEGKGVSNYKPQCTQLPSRLPKVPAQEDETEKPSKAKKQAIKQYNRPVYGGAPFVICYKCWRLLQLPADFLVTRKRLHKLQCGACSEVLVFSFRPRIRTAPHTPNVIQHPHNEIDNNILYARGDSISHSERYSSEAGPTLNVSRSSSYSVQASRLHRLMGYSSASELLFRTGQDDEGYQSTEPSTPHFYRPPKDDYLRYGQYGTGTITPEFTEIEEDEDSHVREKSWRRGSTIPGLLKKGVREFGHGFQSMKLKMHSKG